MRINSDGIVKIILVAIIAILALGIIVSLSIKNNTASFGPPAMGGSGALNGSGPGGKSMGRQNGGMSDFPGENSKNENGESKKVNVQVETMKTGIFIQYLKLYGDIVSAQSVSVTSDVAGELNELYVKPGQKVTKGQLIAHIDPSVPGKNYSLHSVHSPITGSIIDLPVDLGNTITTSTAIASVGDLTNLRLRLKVPEKYIASLYLGQKADVILEAYPDTIIPARIVEISPVLNTSTRTIGIEMEFVQSNPDIKAGMYASASLHLYENSNAITIPAEAVQDKKGEAFVFIFDETKETAAERIVEPGKSSDGRLEIRSGLAAGDKVITGGFSTLKNGDAVNIVE
ncbi:efflux RND transporter periplasmic adaptor subunit [candidate division KSB1 bacterium]|nr:efflux RND transporter periplasmic adaptor subunit [candidate division KSB1 bacterium]